MSGLSAGGVARQHDVLAGHVESGYLPGAVWLVARGDDVVVDAVGTTELGGAVPLRRDAIFRISSMSKLITAVAALILVEECRLRLDEPVDRWLPELASRRVLRTFTADVLDTVPAVRPITLRHLLTFTWGFGGFFAPGGTPLSDAADALDVQTGPPKPITAFGPDEWLSRLGQLPLAHQPGEGWMYNLGSDVIGVLIARVTGQPFEAFLRERVFEPLGMVDTGFAVPESELGRVPASYLPDPTDTLSLYDPGGSRTAWRVEPTFPSGSGGLVSTIDDCHAFARMLSGYGRSGSVRILSRPTVEAMRTDQLTAEQKAGAYFLPGYFDDRGWGFGGAVITRRSGPSAVPGQFGWDGGLGTSLWVDPAEDLIGILLTQRAGFPPLSQVYLDFWTTTYAALDD